MDLLFLSFIFLYSISVIPSSDTSSGDDIYQKDEPMAANQVGHGESLPRLVMQVDHLRANRIEDVVGLVELRGSNVVAEFKF